MLVNIVSLNSIFESWRLSNLFYLFFLAINDILNHVKTLAERVSSIEKHINQSKSIHEIDIAAAPKQEEEEDDGVDLFASDSEEENEAVAKIREERLAAYAAKKSKSERIATLHYVSLI